MTQIEGLSADTLPYNELGVIKPSVLVELIVRDQVPLGKVDQLSDDSRENSRTTQANGVLDFLTANENFGNLDGLVVEAIDNVRFHRPGNELIPENLPDIALAGLKRAVGILVRNPWQIRSATLLNTETGTVVLGSDFLSTQTLHSREVQHILNILPSLAVPLPPEAEMARRPLTPGEEATMVLRALRVCNVSRIHYEINQIVKIALAEGLSEMPNDRQRADMTVHLWEGDGNSLALDGYLQAEFRKQSKLNFSLLNRVGFKARKLATVMGDQIRNLDPRKSPKLLPVGLPQEPQPIVAVEPLVAEPVVVVGSADRSPEEVIIMVNNGHLSVKELSELPDQAYGDAIELIISEASTSEDIRASLHQFLEGIRKGGGNDPTFTRENIIGVALASAREVALELIKDPTLKDRQISLEQILEMAYANPGEEKWEKILRLTVLAEEAYKIIAKAA